MAQHDSIYSLGSRDSCHKPNPRPLACSPTVASNVHIAPHQPHSASSLVSGPFNHVQ